MIASLARASLSLLLTCLLGRLHPPPSVLHVLLSTGEAAKKRCQLADRSAAGRSAMSNGDVPGGYFVGRPTNHTPERKEEPVAAGGHTPGGYFVGRPENHKQEQESAPKPTTKQSTPSFLAKCCPCLAGGGAAE